MKALNFLTFICSLITMGGVLFLILRKEPEQKNAINNEQKLSYVTAKIDKEVEEGPAGDMTTVFRGANPPNQTKVIVHDSKELAKYLTNNFDFYTAKVIPPAGYEWKLAMTPMYFNQGGMNKLTMSFLPTLAESVRPANVIDYWTSKQAADTFYTKYFKPLHDKVKQAGFKSFIFDEGQLWP